MSEHLSREDLAALAEGRVPAERLCAIVLHLMQPCEACWAAFSDHLGAEVELTPERAAAYDAAIDRAFAVALEHDRKLRHQREIERALAILDAKGHRALERPLTGISHLARFDALLEKSWSLRHEDHSRMIDLAKAAMRVAEAFDARTHEVKQVVDLRCRALAELGNARRVAGQLDEAFECFDRAIRLHNAGTGDAALRIRLLDLQASLAADRRQFGLACLILDYVHSYHLSKGDNHLAGRALISKGLYRGYAGEPAEAVRLLQEGLKLIGEEREPSLVLSAVHNQLWFLVEAGDFKRARNHLFLNRTLLEQVGGRVNEIKLVWLEARIHQGRKEFEKAERGLRKVVEGFQQQERAYDVAIASLDLGMVLLSQRRAGEARPILLDAVQVFSDLRIGREAMGAVLLLRQSAEMEEETARLLDLVTQVAAFMRRAEYDPDAKFNPVIR